jgi:hypothetical protein
MMYKILQRKLKIEQHKLHNQGRELRCCRAAPAPKNIQVEHKTETELILSKIQLNDSNFEDK